MTEEIEIPDADSEIVRAYSKVIELTRAEFVAMIKKQNFEAGELTATLRLSLDQGREGLEEAVSTLSAQVDDGGVSREALAFFVAGAVQIIVSARLIVETFPIPLHAVEDMSVKVVRGITRPRK